MSWPVIAALLAIAGLGIIMIWNERFFPPERDPYADIEQARADWTVRGGL